MASIGNLQLTLLNHDHNRNTVTLRVNYTAFLSPVERGMTGLRFREDIELRGADPAPNPDDHLFNFASTSFAVEADGTVNRTRTVTLSENIVDEDDAFWPFDDGTDDVYARVRLTPLLPAGTRRDSNQIHHRF